MLACIACTKDDGEDTARADTPSAKSLTSQIKDMVLKFSGLQCKGGGGGGSSSSSASYRYKGRYHHHHHHQRGAYADMDEDEASDGGSHYAYLRAGSSSSTPAWDFTSVRAEGGKAKWGAGPGNGAVAPADEDVVVEENSGEPKEWTALVEPGVQITFVSLPGGAGNDLKRIRFSREMFNKWQAQRWWGENFDRIMELYNVQKFSRQALPTPPRSDDGGGGDQRESFYSRVGSTRESPVTPPFACRDNNSRTMYRNNNNNNYGGYRAPSTSSSRAGSSGGGYFPSVPDPTEHILPHHLFHHHAVASAAAAAGGGVGVGMRVENSSMDASRTTTSSRDEAASISVSNASDMEMTEWVEQDEPGVYITIRELPDGTRELRRVRFSREKFGEVHAKLWWEDNRERIQAQYL